MPNTPAKSRKPKPDDRAHQKQQASSSPSFAYPFAAIVGQDEMKLALLLNVIDPTIGGVIIMGHRGTGKSTAVRALAKLLPPIRKVKRCMYGCDSKRTAELCDDCAAKLDGGARLTTERAPVPVVDLPLGATEDRVCGTLDIERALVDGTKSFEPGLLARANRGFLYIDEVNLLDDHLVDVLLDSAASGRNVVEREGISISHPARFVLVGSGNPEEGELRPQLLDRFGLFTQIETITDLDQRVEIVQRREQFERDAASFIARWEPEQEALRQRVTRAKRLHARVAIDRGLLIRVAELCVKLRVDGHRGELSIARGARALAALEGRLKATVDEVKRVAAMSLRHRLRKDPLDRIDSGVRIDQAVDELFPSTSRARESRRNQVNL
ncbi:MAG: magnesium chelatase ATPase subunit I [Acidobacteriota bacterium]